MKTIQEQNGEVEYVLTSEEYQRLHEANQAMLEALELIANTGMDAKQCKYYASAAIAKAKGMNKGEQQ